MIRSVTRHVLRRPFSTAGSAPGGSPSRVYEFAAFVASVATVGGALGAFHYLFVEVSISKKIAELNAEVAILKSGQAVLRTEQEGVINVLDAKMSGMASSVTKEVEGMSKTLEAKIATTINSAGLKAEAETLRVLNEYKVYAPRLLTFPPSPTSNPCVEKAVK